MHNVPTINAVDGGCLPLSQNFPEMSVGSQIERYGPVRSNRKFSGEKGPPQGVVHLDRSDRLD